MPCPYNFVGCDNVMADDKKCLIRLTEAALLIANTGQGFTRKGVVAVCASHLGTKHNYRPSDPCPDQPDDSVIEAIRKRELDTYKTNPDRIFSDFRAEEEIQHDYGGRALWELLQNADDAMSPPGTTPAQLIGSKGLGFKSVLELTEEPQIHSGPFHFHFSTVKTHKLRECIPLGQDPPPLTFRIPHPIATTPEVEDLLNKGYVTVIYLPLREEARQKARGWMEKLDPRLLLFCQYLSTLKLIFPDGQSRLYEVNRDDWGSLKDANITIRVVESAVNEAATEYTLWYRRWAATKDDDKGGKRYSAAFCLQIKEDQPAPFEDTPPLHVFFPTKESLPFHALVHASFAVEQSRQHVRDDTSPQLLSLLEELLTRVVHEAPPSVVLTAFVPEPEQMPNNGPAKQIWERFKTVLQECAFLPTIGGGLVKPEEAWLWSYDLGTVLDPTSEEVKKAALVAPELVKSCRRSLELLGASELAADKYPDLLRYCRNHDLEACFKAMKVLYQVVTESPQLCGQELSNYISACRNVPCWWTDEGQARPLEENRPLFKSRPKENLLLWVEPDALDEGFQKRMDELFPSKGADQHGDERRWDALTKDYLLEANDDSLLHKALVPSLARHAQDTWWSEHSGEVLQLFASWTKKHEFDKISPVIWDDEKRIRLARHLKLPTHRGWLPAGQCYAGKAWGGPDSFDSFFREVADRGVLEAPEQWPDGIQPLNPEKWKGRLRYAGVSWEPKLLRFKSDGGSHFFRRTPPNPWAEPGEGNRGEGRNWDYWWDYCKPLKPKSDYFLKEQWALEFFPECLPERAVERLRILKPLGEPVVRSYSQMRFDPDKKHTPSVESLAFYQLRKVAWLPCKPSLLYSHSLVTPSKAYMPGKGLKGLLPEVDVNLPDGQERRDLETFLTQTLRVQEALPAPTSEQWIEWLNKLPEVAGRNKKDITGTARELYEKILDCNWEPPGLAQVKLIPCLVWSDAVGEGRGQGASAEGEHLYFLSKDRVYWLDKPYLENRSVKEALLKEGVAIFLLELKAGEKARNWLGLSPLSEVVEVEPQYQREDDDVTSQLMGRYQQRYQAIQVLARKQKAKVNGISFRAVSQLSIRVSYHGKQVATPRVSWWRTVDGHFLIDAERPWFGAGGAIADTIEGKIAGDVVENLLKAEDEEDVCERLRQHGVAESELHNLNLDVELDTTHANDTGTSRTTTSADQKHHSLSGSSSTKNVSGGSGGGWSDQDAQGEGKDAQEWLREQLKKHLSAMGWHVSQRPDRDNEGRETDVLLRKGEEQVHIEVKHMKSEPRLYWSEREVSKAKEYRGRYFMALLSPNGEKTGYAVGWLWDPLSELQECWAKGTISGIWIWNDKRHPVPSHELGEEPWHVPNPRASQEAHNFSFEIKLNGLECSAVGLEAILEKLPHGL